MGLKIGDSSVEKNRKNVSFSPVGHPVTPTKVLGHDFSRVYTDFGKKLVAKYLESYIISNIESKIY